MLLAGLLLVAVLGAALGSYVAASVHAAASKNPAPKRSQCSNCHHVLGIPDLIPVVSGILLKGRCRYCNKAFGYRHVYIEAAMGVLFVLTYLATYGTTALGNLAPLIIGLIISYLTVSTSAFDLVYRAFPTTGLIVGTVFLMILQTWTGGMTALLGHLISSGLLMSILGSLILIGRWTKRDLMGEGDVYLGLFLGSIFLPLEATMVLTLGSILGVLISLGLLASHRIHQKTALPFAPFLMSSAWVVFLILQ